MSIKKFGCALFCITFLYGCTTPAGYRQPIDTFERASSVVIASTRAYTSELNKVERDKYIDGQQSNKKNIKLIDLESVQVFDQEGISARLEAMALLAKYGSLLSQLANSDVPDRVESGAVLLGTASVSLVESLNVLTESKKNESFKKSAIPVANIIGQIGKLVVERKITQALNKAINEGEKPIQNLIQTISSDLTISYERKRNALSDERVNRVDEYNDSLSGDAELIKIKAERIAAQEDKFEAFASADPGEGLQAMATAHKSLVDYARSPKKPTDLATFVAAMETFAARATIVGESLRALREMK